MVKALARIGRRKDASNMFEKLLALPSTYFDTHPSARLISRITFDANQVTEAASYVLTVLVKDSLAILGLLAWMFYLNWQLALVSFTAMPVVVFVVYYFSKHTPGAGNIDTSAGMYFPTMLDTADEARLEHMRQPIEKHDEMFPQYARGASARQPYRGSIT